jgi:hypothetical protein
MTPKGFHVGLFNWLNPILPHQKPMMDVRRNVRAVLSTFVAHYGRVDPGNEEILEHGRALLAFTHIGCERMLDGLISDASLPDFIHPMRNPLIGAINSNPYRHIQRLFCTYSLSFSTLMVLLFPDNPVYDMMIDAAMQMYSQPPSTFHDAMQCYNATQRLSPTDDVGTLATRFENCALNQMCDSFGIPPLHPFLTQHMTLYIEPTREKCMELSKQNGDFALVDLLLRDRQ